jgi:divalent metal cation (Fe/Co/Zn/Cd) transporter
MEIQNDQSPEVQRIEKADLNKRLETIGWGLFLILLAGSALFSREWFPDGLWAIGVGLIMLGLNIARYLYKIRMSTFTTILGIIAILTGIAQLLGLNLPGLAILLFLLGLYLIAKPWFDRYQLFVKAEDN